MQQRVVPPVIIAGLVLLAACGRTADAPVAGGGDGNGAAPANAEGVTTVGAADLGVDVLTAVDVADGGHVAVARPEGEPYEFPVGTSTPSQARLITDDEGGRVAARGREWWHGGDRSR